MATKKIGLQIHSVYDIYYRDPVEAFKLIKSSGYDAVEMFGNINMGAKELKELFEDAGLECCGWHVPWEYMNRPDILEMFVLYNKVIGNRYLIISNFPNEYTQDEYTWLKLAYKINEIAARLKKYDMCTGIHAQVSAFQMVEDIDELAWDILAKNTCGNVVLQLNIGNAYPAGIEPVEILKKYKKRSQTIHINPYYKNPNITELSYEDDMYSTESGNLYEDSTDWKEAVKFCNEEGDINYFIIEYEQSEKSIIKMCKDNFMKYLHNI